MQSDVLVAGLGAAGSAALYQFARRGVKVVGIDRFHPPHDRGSSHGDTRITRLALGEGAHYVPFARRSHEIWRELEAETGRALFRQVGALVYGASAERRAAHGAEDFLATTIAVAREHGLPHEVLEAADLRDRFPQFRFRGDERGCLEPGAGLVHPEACIAAQLEMAQRHGALVRTGEQVIRWETSGEGVRLVTDRGTYEAGALVLCLGSWMPSMVGAMAQKARVFRQVLHWFEPEGDPIEFGPDKMPVYIRVPDAGTAMFYGFPNVDGPGGGLKIAGEQFEQTCDPDAMATEVGPEEVAAMHRLAAPHVRIGSRCLRSVACRYTVTPDFDFILDRHPENGLVWLASPCSGHGFKHSAAVGEALADRVMGVGSGYDLDRFALARSGLQWSR